MQINYSEIKHEGAISQSTERLVAATEAAYVQSGTYADTPRGLAEGIYVDIKYSPDPELHREGLLKYDISPLIPGSVKYTLLIGSYVNMDAERRFDVYQVDADWDASTVTYNTRPQGTLIAKDITFGGKGQPLELSAQIEAALARGEKTLSIRIVPKWQTGAGQTRIQFSNVEKPLIMILDEKPEKNYFEKLVADEEDNAAIWSWAKKMFDEWYARYRSLSPLNEKAEMIVPDPAQYTKSTYAAQQSNIFENTKVLHPTRTLEAITDLDAYTAEEFKDAPLDQYGGVMIESLKQESTGFFHTQKINGRWWMIDPLGYPYICIGLSHINYSLNGSQLQKENALKKYGSFENWAAVMTKEIRDDLSFNASFSPRAEVANIEGGLPYMSHVGVMSTFGGTKKVRGHGNGSTVFVSNNTMPVFDPDFEDFARAYFKEKLNDVNNPRIIGYTSDNELPMSIEMLDNSLSVNHLYPVNHHTYACAWTWLANMTGKENPSFSDVTDELRDLFRGFVYDRYFNVVSKTFREADSNHLYMGCRFLTVSKDSNWVYRFAAQYLSCMTINWYFSWEPQSDALYGIERNGDLPFVVTEFYSKAGDSGLANTSGAGFYVQTQTDRADFYENFTTKLLQSRNCVGWQLFHYMDNDPNSGTSDRSSINSNKGIYNNNYEQYTDFTNRLAIFNKNVYKLVSYFQNKK